MAMEDIDDAGESCGSFTEADAAVIQSCGRAAVVKMAPFSGTACPKAQT